MDIAAVYYLLAERFYADPFLILARRGRPRERLLAELGALRGDAEAANAERMPIAELENGQSPGVPGWVTLLGEADLPIEADPDRFWGAAEPVPLFEQAPIPTSLPGAILRELPASGLTGHDGRPIEASLERVYEEIVRAATERLDPRGT